MAPKRQPVSTGAIRKLTSPSNQLSKRRRFHQFSSENKLTKQDSASSDYFYHYTNCEGISAIIKTQFIKESKVKGLDAVFGQGVYLTMIGPYVPKEVLARNNWGGQWQQVMDDGKLDYVVELEIPREKVKRANTPKNIFLHEGAIHLNEYPYKILNFKNEKHELLSSDKESNDDEEDELENDSEEQSESGDENDSDERDDLDDENDLEEQSDSDDEKDNDEHGESDNDNDDKKESESEEEASDDESEDEEDAVDEKGDTYDDEDKENEYCDEGSEDGEDDDFNSYFHATQ